MTILENLIMQSLLIPQYRASVFAVYGSLCWLSSSVGTLIFGYLVENISLSMAVTIEAMITFVMICVVYSYKIRNREMDI